MVALASFCLPNFVSFLFLPTKPPTKPKTPPAQLPLSFPILKQPKNGGCLSLVAQESNSSWSSSSISSVICPSLAYSNTLFFSSTYNVQVVVNDNWSEEKLLSEFRRKVMKAGVIQECKRRRFFENKREAKKRKIREAAKRNSRRRSRYRETPPKKQDAPSSKREEDEDNWDLPEGDIPY
ncbi:small ribosomal subunit protein bS21c-like [Ziziphus jujuba]|uniref:Small ribosomal subunit protein bS21c-like n=1 Tax=Ziziphus jujuba TaxID=326968 RepID=A0ABM3ZSS0_ZIZJJ|nr:small ribosomal subunit protein bS21c-like [Ziziphus jujuba]